MGVLVKSLCLGVFSALSSRVCCTRVGFIRAPCGTEGDFWLAGLRKKTSDVCLMRAGVLYSYVVYALLPTSNNRGMLSAAKSHNCNR